MRKERYIVCYIQDVFRVLFVFKGSSKYPLFDEVKRWVGVRCQRSILCTREGRACPLSPTSPRCSSPRFRAFYWNYPVGNGPAQTLMEKHRHRELTVKMLEAFKAGRSKRIAELRAAEVEKALEEVAAKVGGMFRGSNRSTMDRPIDALLNPSK